MCVMVLVKATKDSEAGIMPSIELLEAMGKYNQELVDAGILAGEFGGLHPSSKGKRVSFDGPRRNVIDGPFAETKELVAGFWLWEVRTWPKRSSGSGAAPTRCLDRARSKFAPYSKRPTLVTRLRQGPANDARRKQRISYGQEHDLPMVRQGRRGRRPLLRRDLSRQRGGRRPPCTQ